MCVPVIKAPFSATHHSAQSKYESITNWQLMLVSRWVKVEVSVLADMSPTLVPSRNILYFCGPLLLYIYFWPRLSRARLGSGVVYVTGQIGLPNSERLTLSNVHTGRQPTWGRSGGGGEWLGLEVLMVHQVRYRSLPSVEWHWPLQPRSCKCLPDHITGCNFGLFRWAVASAAQGQGWRLKEN